MPFIHIKTLPLAEPIDIPVVLENICQDFSDETTIDSEHITVTWDYYKPNHYLDNGVIAAYQPSNSHSVLVDLIIPDFHSEDSIESMLNCIADSIERHTKIPLDNIFINCRLAHSGRVYDGGQLVTW